MVSPIHGIVSNAWSNRARWPGCLIQAANAAGLTAELPEAAAFVWAAVEGDEDDWSERLARDHGIPALPGRHFHAATPHLRIPFGGRPEAREALLRAFSEVRRPAVHR